MKNEKKLSEEGKRRHSMDRGETQHICMRGGGLGSSRGARRGLRTKRNSRGWSGRAPYTYLGSLHLVLKAVWRYN